MIIEINQFNYKNHINKKLFIRKRSGAYSRLMNCRMEEVADRPSVIDVWVGHLSDGDLAKNYLGRFDIFTFISNYEVKSIK